MTTEEKNEMYRRNQQKQIKGRKTNIIAVIVLLVAGVAITLLLNFISNMRQSEIAEATVLDSMPISEFLAQNETGSAIYTGEIKAVNPVVSKEEGGEFISFMRKAEREEKIYNEKEKKYETKTTALPRESEDDFCQDIEIDDVVVPYKYYHDLPSYSKTDYEGADSNRIKTTFSYTPSHLEGTFFLKCKNGEVSSAQYYGSEDVAGESKKGFNIARAIIWIIIIGIEIYLILGIVRSSKAIKNIEGKLQ